MGLPSKATHQQTRAHNTALVLRALYDHGPISRAEVARMSGLTRTTVGEVVAELVKGGLAREVGRGPSTGGKAPILVELVDGARHVIGVDLGEFAFRAAVVDLRGRELRTAERPVDGLNGAQALEVVYGLLDELIRDASGVLLGVGIGTPGIVDAPSGTIRWAVNLDWQDLPLGRLVAERYGVRVEVANDSRAAALAILLFGDDDPARRGSNLVAIKVGRGIGAGIVLGGELFHGDGAGAGEIGHVAVEDDGAECRCGRFGCLETVASSRAIVEKATRSAYAAPASALGRRLTQSVADGRDRLELDDVRAALADGDPEAAAVVAAAGRYLGRAIAALIGVLDVERIYLHGSVTQLGAAWLGAVRDEARRRSLGPLAREVSIEVVPPMGDLVVRGAAGLLLTSELGLGAGPAAAAAR